MIRHIADSGHGKSIIFQLLVDFCKELNLRGLPYPIKGIIVVVFPWNSLVDSHVRSLESRGISATRLTGDVDEKRREFYAVITPMYLPAPNRYFRMQSGENAPKR